ncbi:Oxidation resistance protein 1 [Nymphon striatum]|nr:Oxidation resistance protein 1 [Nymphon striatum]
MFKAKLNVKALIKNIRLGDDKLKSPPQESKAVEKTTEKKMVTRSITQPEGAMQFTVAATDTLAGIAARFYTTPSELTKLNKLSSRLIFPGQVIYVPKKDAPEDNRCVTPPSTPADKEVTFPFSSNLVKTPSEAQSMSKPGHVERVVSPIEVAEALNRKKSLSPTLSLEEEERKLDEECHKKFLKITVKHITDGQGIVDGVLLVTPNALMFDPNVSDTLVVEHGTEKYSVTCPMSMVANAALYKDISLMRLKHIPQNDNDAMTVKTSEVYHHEECPRFDSPKKEIAGSIEDDDVFSECVCSKSPTKTIPLNDAQNISPTSKDASAKSKPLPKQQNELPSQDLLDVSSSEQADKDSSKKENEQTDQNIADCSEESKILLSEDLKKETSEKVSNEKDTTSELESLLADSSSKNASSTSDDKRNWYSQLSDISHLPTQIDFSLFRTQKSASQSEATDLMLSTSCSESMDQSAADSHRVRLLKRLSQPVSWIESFASGSVDSAVEMTASAQSTLSKILPHPFSSSSEKDDTPPSSAHTYVTRNFSTSPHSFVDFSSGLFFEEDLEKLKGVGDLSSTGLSKSFGSSDKASAISAAKSGLLESSESVDSAESVRRLFLNTDMPTSSNASVNKVQIQNMVEDKPDLFTNIDIVAIAFINHIFIHIRTLQSTAGQTPQVHFRSFGRTTDALTR